MIELRLQPNDGNRGVQRRLQTHDFASFRKTRTYGKNGYVLKWKHFETCCGGTGEGGAEVTAGPFETIASYSAVAFFR